MNHISENKISISIKTTKLLNDSVFKSFKDNAIMRFIFRTEHVDEQYKEIKFNKIGINNIMNKEWLTPNDAGFISKFNVEEIGQSLGRSIALAENKNIIENILNEMSNSNKRKVEDLSEELFKAKDDFDIILTNIYENHKFWHMESFKHNPEKLHFCEGTIFNKKIFWFSNIPAGITIMINGKKFAEILEKIPLNLQLFEKLDKNILNELPNLKTKHIEDLIRILAYETIGFKILDKKGALIIETAKTGP